MSPQGTLIKGRGETKLAVSSGTSQYTSLNELKTVKKIIRLTQAGSQTYGGFKWLDLITRE